MDTEQTWHIAAADTETAMTDTMLVVTAEEMDPAVKAIVPGSMSGAEIVAYWEREGVFETLWPQYEDIGPGKRFANSTEYVQHIRQQSVRRHK